MMPSKLSAQRPNGFTLIETIMYIALSSLALSTLLFVHVSGLRTRSIALNQQILLENQRLVQFHLLERMQESDAVFEPLEGSSNQFSISSTVAGEHPVIFAMSDGRLTLSVAGAAPQPLTTSTVTVTDFMVERFNGDPASVLITIAYQIGTSGNAVLTNETVLAYTFRYD